MFRFFVDHREGDTFPLSREVINHVKVARVEKKEFICIHDGSFFLTYLNGDSAIIIREIEENHEFDGNVIVASAIINIKRFEWLIQKAAELGAKRIIPFFSKNVSVKMGNDVTKKVKRWNEIAKNASEQSFRNVPLTVDAPIPFSEVMKVEAKNKFIAHEKSIAPTTKEFPQDSLFLVGPEGGFTDDEVLLAQSNDFQEVSLGKRILRAETAPIFMLSRIN